MGVAATLPTFQANPGAIIVWGDNSAQQITNTPPGNDFAQIATGGNVQSLAIRKDGTLKLWDILGGNNVVDPNAPVGTMPAPIAAGVRFIDAVLSVTHGLAVADDGKLYPFGHFAQPSNPLSTAPPALKANKHLAKKGHCVATGGSFCVVIDENKELCQWEAGATKTVVPPGNFQKVAARNNYTIALSEEGDLYGWGPPFDALWNPPSATEYLADWELRTIGSLVYYYLEGPKKDPYVDLAAGNARKVPPSAVLPAPLLDAVPHFLALSKEGAVYGWGKNTDGEAQGAPAGVKFKAISAGAFFSIGLDEYGLLHHWGNPELSGLGGVASPTNLGNVPLGRFKAIGAGSHHAAAVRG